MEFLTPEESHVFHPKGVHEQLYVQRERMAEIAGVSPHWFWQPLGNHAGPREVEWAKQVRNHAREGKFGIAYFGEHPGDRLDALVGTMCRAELDARLATARKVLKDPGVAGCELLVIPDFCVSGAQAPSWKVDGMAELLLSRASAWRQTVVYAVDMASVRSCYGALVFDHVVTKFMGDPR